MIGPCGFEKAIVGVGEIQTSEGVEQVLVYDVDKMVEILCEDASDMTRDEALEYIDFNVIAAYFGQTGPCFLRPVENWPLERYDVMH